MNKVSIIAKEFKSSTLKAIRSLSKSDGIPENILQIGFQIDGNGNNLYKLYKNFAPVRVLQAKEIIHVSLIYAPFKGKFPKGINDILFGIAKHVGVKPTEINVISGKNQTGDSVRLMLYVQGKYKQDITEKDFENVNA